MHRRSEQAPLRSRSTRPTPFTVTKSRITWPPVVPPWSENRSRLAVTVTGSAWRTTAAQPSGSNKIARVPRVGFVDARLRVAQLQSYTFVPSWSLYNTPPRGGRGVVVEVVGDCVVVVLAGRVVVVGATVDVVVVVVDGATVVVVVVGPPGEWVPQRSAAERSITLRTPANMAPANFVPPETLKWVPSAKSAATTGPKSEPHFHRREGIGTEDSVRWRLVSDRDPFGTQRSTVR